MADFPAKDQISRVSQGSRCVQFAASLREHAERECADALDRRDLAKWIQFDSYKDWCRYPELNFGWAFQSPSRRSYSLEDFLHDFDTERSRNVMKKLAEAAKGMYEVLREEGMAADAALKEGHAISVLKRVRMEIAPAYNYYVLAVMPREYLAQTAYEKQPSEARTAVVLFKPATLCISHACDVLYKEKREEGGKASAGVLCDLELTPVPELRCSALARTVDHFVDPDTRTMQSPNDMLLKGLLKLYENERESYCIPMAFFE